MATVYQSRAAADGRDAAHGDISIEEARACYAADLEALEALERAYREERRHAKRLERWCSGR